MKHITSLIIILLVAIGFSSCEKVKGKGEVVSQLRTVTGYSSISLSVNATIYFTIDSSYYMEVRAQQNILDVLETTVGANSNLEIRYRKGVVVGKHEPISIFIAAPDIRGFDISGSGELFVNNPLLTGYVNLGVSGSGDISIFQMNVLEVDASISGSGNIGVNTGGADLSKLSISGSGNMEMGGVETDTCYITISGSGNATVWATDLLDVTISGSGNVFYKGNPVVVTHISGSGTINRIG